MISSRIIENEGGNRKREQDRERAKTGIESRFRQVRPQNRLQRHFRNNDRHARATAKETEEADAAGDCQHERAGSVGGVRRWHLAWMLLLSAVEVEEAECLQGTGKEAA